MRTIKTYFKRAPFPNALITYRAPNPTQSRYCDTEQSTGTCQRERAPEVIRENIARSGHRAAISTKEIRRANFCQPVQPALPVLYQKLPIIQTLDSEFEFKMARCLPSGEGKPQVWVDSGRCQMGCASPLSETCNKIAPPGASVETNIL